MKKKICQTEKKVYFPSKTLQNPPKSYTFPSKPSKNLRNLDLFINAQIVTKYFQEKIIWSDI